MSLSLCADLITVLPQCISFGEEEKKRFFLFLALRLTVSPSPPATLCPSPSLILTSHCLSPPLPHSLSHSHLLSLSPPPSLLFSFFSFPYLSPSLTFTSQSLSPSLPLALSL